MLYFWCVYVISNKKNIKMAILLFSDLEVFCLGSNHVDAMDRNLIEFSRRLKQEWRVVRIQKGWLSLITLCICE